MECFYISRVIDFLIRTFVRVFERGQPSWFITVKMVNTGRTGAKAAGDAPSRSSRANRWTQKEKNGGFLVLLLSDTQQRITHYIWTTWKMSTKSLPSNIEWKEDMRLTAMAFWGRQPTGWFRSGVTVGINANLEPFYFLFPDSSQITGVKIKA